MYFALFTLLVLKVLALTLLKLLMKVALTLDVKTYDLVDFRFS